MSTHGFWTIKDRMGNITTKPADPNAHPHVPQDMPTYRRLSCIHTGDPPMETRLRAASLEDSCRNMNADPPDPDLMDAIHSSGHVNHQQAQQLRDFVRRVAGDAYLVDETLLLLEAAGHVGQH